MTQKQCALPRGTNDILPEDIALWSSLEQQARVVLKKYNYQEIRTPFFEETELFARSMGQTSDVVQKQMLNLASQRTDEAGHIQLSGLSLRPENTAAVVRAYIQHGMNQREALSKLFYVGPMFRGERPQKGRLRQFHQIGVEAIGASTSSPYLDAEVISLSVALLKAVGINEFTVKINSLGTPEDKERFSQNLRSALTANVSLLCGECQARFERNVFRVLDCKNPGCREQVAHLAVTDSYLSPESEEYFERVCDTLRKQHIPFEVSPQLVRGLDYYTHTVFEISSSLLGSQDALGAGGRYNNLVEQLGGPQVDAVGFALGMERIILALGASPISQSSGVDIYVLPLAEAAFEQAFTVTSALRESVAGACVDMSYRVLSVKNQMRQANKVGARVVVLIGEDEIQKKCVTVKDMQTGEQQQIALAACVEKLGARYKK